MSNYAYISGVIKYREKNLLNPTDIDRMTEAKSADDAFRVFNATDYADNLLDVATQDYQKTLDDDLGQIKKLFFAHLELDLLKFLFLKYDAHNIKLFFKEKYSGKNLDNFTSQLGIEKWENIKKYINGEKIEVDENIRHIIEKTKSFIGERPFPHRIDYIVDREYFHILWNIAKNLKNKYIQGLIRLQIDIVNLKILIRAKITKKPYFFVEKKFIKYGGISRGELKSLYNQEIEQISDYFKNYFNDKEIKHVFDNFKEDNGSFWKIEKALENLELNYIKKTKSISYGPEIPIGYYYAKKNAIRNVRLIMTGKINNISTEEIRERLRNIY